MEPAIGTPKRSLLPPVPTLREQPCETFSQPPLDGSLCTAEIYEWHARHSPNHPVFQYLEDDGTGKTITFADAIHAIYRGGWLLRSAMQGSSYPQGQRQIVATVALSETISYCIVTLATQRANFILFPISPRNSPAAVAHLLTQVHADLLLVGQESSMQNLVNNAFEYMKSSNVDVHLPPTSVMPTFADVFPEHAEPALPLPPLQYNLDDVTMIMHSSGSTAFPKPIPWTFFRMTSLARLPYYGEVDFTGLRIAVHSVPMFHGMGTTQVGWVGAVGTTMTCFKPTSPPRARAPSEMLREAYALKSDYIFCTPHFPEAWSKNSEDTEMLKQMRGVLFGGGPLMKEAGDSLVASGVNMYLIYGCTEYGIMNSILPKTGPKEWEYFSFGKTVRTHWVVQDEGSPGISKLILLDRPLGSPSVTNCVIDGIPGFDTNDLFSVHPTNPDLWKIYGRADDQIMHSIGEKTNPGPLEAILNRDNHISHAIMFGRGRFNVGVLVDPIPELRFDPADTERLAAFRNLIWPTIERMNEYAPQHSRVFKEMIIVSSSNKPFSYTGKGTPRRHAIIKEYLPEIDALYATVAESTQASVPPPRQWNMEETLSFVRAIVNNVLERTVQDPQDIFQHGCDSLQATWIRNSILHALRATSKSSTREIPINFVYNNPTVSRLASFVYAVTNSGYSRTEDRSAAVQAMQDMLNKYTHRFSLHAPVAEQDNFPTGDVVLLTGTTGGLGSALLTQLVAMPEVTKIYALNRKGSTALRERQRDVLSDRGYDADGIIGSSKVVLLEADLTQSTFGLPDTTCKEIRESVTHIIHNAWPVNFNLSLSSFEPSIKGLRSLIDLALSSPRPMPPRVIYISSQGVLRDVDHRMPIKEQFVDASVAVGTGYSESKWVAEEILASTTCQTRLPTISIRLGQVAGSGSGAWNVQEWVPSLIKSSLSLGRIPVLSEDVTWMNADDVARAVLEARSASPDLSPIHIQHPRPVPWRDVFGPIAVNYGLSPVPFDSWFASLYESAQNHQQHNANPNDAAHANRILPAKSTLSGDAKGAQNITPNNDALQGNPALKLLSFFRACNDSFKECGIVFPRLDTTKSQSLAARKSLGEEMLNPLMLRDVRRWLKYWERVGFLPPVPTFK